MHSRWLVVVLAGAIAPGGSQAAAATVPDAGATAGAWSGAFAEFSVAGATVHADGFVVADPKSGPSSSARLTVTRAACEGGVYVLDTWTDDRATITPGAAPDAWTVSGSGTLVHERSVRSACGGAEERWRHERRPDVTATLSASITGDGDPAPATGQHVTPWAPGCIEAQGYGGFTRAATGSLAVTDPGQRLGIGPATTTQAYLSRDAYASAYLYKSFRECWD